MSKARRSIPGLRVLFALPVLAIIFGGCLLKLPSTEELTEDTARELKMPVYAPVPAEAITLEKAVELALIYNLDTRAKNLEQDIKHELATGAKLGMLPSGSLRGERKRRSREDASTSRDFHTNIETTSPTYSEMTHSKTYTIDMTWSLLDFGMNFLKSRQAENEAFIAQLKFRRVRQNLALDVIKAYWKAAIAKATADKCAPIIKQLEERRKQVQKSIEMKVLSEVEGLEEERTLAQMIVRLREQERQAQSAVADLGAIIGMPPGAKISLKIPEFKAPEKLPAFDMAKLEEEALNNRPEIGQFAQQERVQIDEVRIALLKMFPNVNLFAKRDHDDNPLLVYQKWNTLGMNAALELLTIPQHLRSRAAAKIKLKMTRRKKLAMAAGIMSQLHLSVIAVNDAARTCEEAGDLNSLSSRLIAALKKKQDVKEADASTVAKTSGDGIFAEVKFMRACADYNIAMARVQNTLGKIAQKTNPTKLAETPVEEELSQESETELFGELAIENFESDEPEKEVIVPEEPAEEILEEDLAEEKAVEPKEDHAAAEQFNNDVILPMILNELLGIQKEEPEVEQEQVIDAQDNSLPASISEFLSMGDIRSER